MKAYTDLEQSKKLAEILPIKSADCYWDYDEMQKFHRISWFEDGFNKHSQLLFNENNVCAWSLAALLDILPQGTRILKSSTNDTYHCDCPKENIDKWFDNPIDACYEMILKLNEEKLL